MSATPSVVRDERTVAVENASYRWPFGFLTFALLIDVMYRGLFRDEAAWDLMVIVFVGGVLSTVYRARRKTLPHGWVKSLALGGCVAAVVAAIATAITVWCRR